MVPQSTGSLESQGVAVKENQSESRTKSTLTESLAIASIYSLQKNARRKYCRRMWRAYAAKHCLKRLKKQRQKAKKLRRKFFKRQGRWVMKAWRDMHRRHMRCAHVIIRAFRRYIALTCVSRLRKAQKMVTSKVAFALVKKSRGLVSASWPRGILMRGSVSQREFVMEELDVG